MSSQIYTIERTQIAPLTKIRNTNSTDSSFPSRIPTVTEPTGSGVMRLNRVKGFSANNLKVIPYGAGSDNTTFDMRVIGWEEVNGLYVPAILAQVSVTLCGAVGVSGQAVTDSERFADTLSVTVGNSGVDVSVISPGADVSGHFVVDLKGCAIVEITFDMTGATSGNALVKEL